MYASVFANCKLRAVKLLIIEFVILIWIYLNTFEGFVIVIGATHLDISRHMHVHYVPYDVCATELRFSLSLSLPHSHSRIMQIRCGERDHGPLAEGCTTAGRCHGLGRFCMSYREVTSGTA